MSDVPEFSARCGFARLADLDHPELQRWLGVCEQENESFSGSAHLDWSRQWEYPWVLANLPASGGGRRVLDAGSGYRFFTPLLASRGFEVDACDLDASIGPRLDEVAARDDLAIEFTTQDLAQLTYADATFDYICCISVLEHTADPERIAAEYHRCLKPGGRLLLTFDVSVDGDRDIPVDRARHLVELLIQKFRPVHEFRDAPLLDAERLRADESILRTAWFRRNRPELLPWRFVSRSYLQGLRRLRFGRPFFDLAVVALALEKPAG